MNTISIILIEVLLVLLLLAILQVRRYVLTLMDVVQAMADNLIAKNNLESFKDNGITTETIDKQNSAKATEICEFLKRFLGQNYNAISQDGEYRTIQFVVFNLEDSAAPEQKGLVIDAFLHNGTLNTIDVIEDILVCIDQTPNYFKFTPFKENKEV